MSGPVRALCLLSPFMHNSESPEKAVKDTGFTLLEVMVALAIAATALVVMMSRLGNSADIQYSLRVNALAIETAMDQLARERLKPNLPRDGEKGDVQALGQKLAWKITVKKTPVEHFFRLNITVGARGEPDVHLFLYRMEP